MTGRLAPPRTPHDHLVVALSASRSTSATARSQPSGLFPSGELARWVHDGEISNPADHRGEPEMPAKGTPAQLERWLKS